MVMTEIERTIISLFPVIATALGFVGVKESALVISKPGLYADEPEIYWVTGQQRYILTIKTFNPCKLVEKLQKYDPYVHLAAKETIKACYRRYERLIGLWQMTEHRGSNQTAKPYRLGNLEYEDVGRRRNKRDIGSSVLGVPFEVHNDVFSWSAISASKIIAPTDAVSYESAHKVMKAIGEKMKSLQDDLLHLAQASEVNHLLNEAITNVTAIFSEWTQGRVTHKLFDALGISWPYYRPPELIRPLSLKCTVHGSYSSGDGSFATIEIFLLVASVEYPNPLRVVDPFTTYVKSDKGDEWCEIRYIGPTVVSAKPKACGFEFAKRAGKNLYLKSTCLGTNNPSERIELDLWQKNCATEEGGQITPEIQQKFVDDRNYIYCFDATIDIDGNGPVECPNHVFSLPANRSFHIPKSGFRWSGTIILRRIEDPIKKELSKLAVAIAPDYDFAAMLKPARMSSQSFLSRLTQPFVGLFDGSIDWGNPLVPYLTVGCLLAIFLLVRRHLRRPAESESDSHGVES